MKGWIVNLDRNDSTCEVERVQKPIFYFDDGCACFEVWKWHSTLHRWFVMSYKRDRAQEEQGVIFYTPEDVPTRLREIMQQLERIAQHCGAA